MNKTFIISLGGSLIVPHGQEGLVDLKFLKELKKTLIAYAKKGYKFILITGGGDVCRKYQAAAKKLAKPSWQDTDVIGIAVTKVNATLIQRILKPHSPDFVIEDPTIKHSFKKPILVASGWKEGVGWSTDYDAVILAQTYQCDSLVNLSNTPCIYTADPNRDKTARPLKKTTWAVLQKIVGTKWESGLSRPFDPIATKKAAELGLTLYDLCGWNIKNFKNFLDGKTFVGTIVSDK